MTRRLTHTAQHRGQLLAMLRMLGRALFGMVLEPDLLQ
jgi:uncharacterized damage-inducible protein DinB